MAALHAQTSTVAVLRERLPRELAAHLTLARNLRPASTTEPPDPPFPFALSAVDALLAGGVARGRLVELLGRPGSGRFSLALSALAAATGAGEAAVLVDLGEQLDPRHAAACGVDLERLLWVRVHHVREALAAAEICIGGSFPLVVLELGVPPLPGGRGPQAHWLRLARTARRHRAALLVSTPYRTSGSAAAEVLTTRAGRILWRGSRRTPPLLAGIDCAVTLEKSRRGGRLPNPVHLALVTPEAAPLRSTEDGGSQGAPTRIIPALRSAGG